VLALPSKALLDTIDEAVKVAAVVVGAAWTFLNYVRGRTFRSRLDVDLTGSISERHKVQIFVGACTAKNVGLSKVPLQKVGTGASVYALRLTPRKSGGFRLVEQEIRVFQIFDRHGWVEPGEEIAEPFAVTVPDGAGELVAVRVQVMISSGKTTWSASNITELQDAKKKEKADDLPD
jgi:hypothetical protein